MDSHNKIQCDKIYNVKVPFSLMHAKQFVGMQLKVREGCIEYIYITTRNHYALRHIE